jgi:hypothetical protein
MEEIVMDNRAPFMKALEILGKRYKIFNIWISAYNSRANRIVKRAHWPVRESIMKAVDGVEAKWPSAFHSVFWSEQVTIQCSTGYSPYRIAHGVDPLFPFDLAKAMYLVHPLEDGMDTDELIAIRAWQLEKRDEDLEMVKEWILKACYESVRQFLDRHQHTIRDYDFKTRTLVLVRNSLIEMELNWKSKPRYFGPMVVVKRTERGAYVLAELDGAVAKTSYAAFRIVPYFARVDSDSQAVATEETKRGQESDGDTEDPGSVGSSDEESDEEGGSAKGLLKRVLRPR